MTAEGTSGDLYEWMSQARPQLKFQGPQKKYTNEVISTVAISLVKEGNALVVMKMVPPTAQPNPPAENKPLKKLGYDKDGFFDLPTYWVAGPSGWMLDGTACLKSLKAEQPVTPPAPYPPPRPCLRVDPPRPTGYTTSEGRLQACHYPLNAKSESGSGATPHRGLTQTRLRQAGQPPHKPARRPDQ